MPYVERDGFGHVKGRFASEQVGRAEEWLDDGHPDLGYKSPEEIAKEALAAEDALAKAYVKARPTVKYLATHTPAECRTYVETNVNNLAEAKALLADYAEALCVLFRREFR